MNDIINVRITINNSELRGDIILALQFLNTMYKNIDIKIQKGEEFVPIIGGI